MGELVNTWHWLVDLGHTGLTVLDPGSSNDSLATCSFISQCWAEQWCTFCACLHDKLQLTTAEWWYDCWWLLICSLGWPEKSWPHFTSSRLCRVCQGQDSGEGCSSSRGQGDRFHRPILHTSHIHTITKGNFLQCKVLFQYFAIHRAPIVIGWDETYAKMLRLSWDRTKQQVWLFASSCNVSAIWFVFPFLAGSWPLKGSCADVFKTLV